MGGLNSTITGANINLKIGNFQKDIEMIVVEVDNFAYDLLLGLNVTKSFNLEQNKNLKINQKLIKN